ncbi:MAG TPA: AAA family ATPase, partial [Gimesia maris]|nr:AAA family ATPase [Gimesia maris]
MPTVTSLTQKLAEHVAACFPGLWIQSHEHQDALTEIAQLCHDSEWQLATWDIDTGLSVPGQTEQGGSSNDP